MERKYRALLIPTSGRYLLVVHSHRQLLGLSMLLFAYLVVFPSATAE